MKRGIVDGSVLNKEHGERVLSLVLDVVDDGSIVIVSTQKVTVDRSRCPEYPRRRAAEGESEVDTD